jgi:paraquat-inducible protein B
MSKKANPTAIGFFVLAALVVAAAALAFLGSGKLFTETRTFVLFFDSSLSGLDVGAPVEYHGVRVGSVTRIFLQYDTSASTVLTPVYIEMERDRMTYKGDEQQAKSIEYHVQQGLRAQLQPQSLVTGKLKIMMVDKPGSELRLVGGDPETAELPTIPTLTESLAAKIEALPLSEIIVNLNKSVEAIAQFTASGDLTNAMARVNGILEEVHMLASNVNAALPSVLQSAKLNADQFLRVQDDISGVLEEMKQLMATRSPERQQFLQTMRGMEDAALALRDLLAYLQLHPEALITGKKEK